MNIVFIVNTHSAFLLPLDNSYAITSMYLNKM